MQGVYSYDGATGKTGPDAVPVAQQGVTRVLGNQFFLDLKRSPAAVKVCVHDEQFCASSGTDGRRSIEDNFWIQLTSSKNKIAVDERSSVARSPTLPFPTLFAGRAVTHSPAKSFYRSSLMSPLVAVV